MPTRSELMYFALGLSIGGAVGANWSKIKPLLEAFMGPAAAGFMNAYGDLAEKFSDQAAASAEPKESKKPKSRSRKKSAKSVPSPPAWFEELANSMSAN